MMIVVIFANIVVSAQIVFRADNIKLLCFMIQTLAQGIFVTIFAVIFFPGRWVNHREKKKRAIQVKAQYGSSGDLDESTPVVESMSSQSLSEEKSSN